MATASKDDELNVINKTTLRLWKSWAEFIKQESLVRIFNDSEIVAAELRKNYVEISELVSISVHDESVNAVLFVHKRIGTKWRTAADSEVIKIMQYPSDRSVMSAEFISHFGLADPKLHVADTIEQIVAFISTPSTLEILIAQQLSSKVFKFAGEIWREFEINMPVVKVHRTALCGFSDLDALRATAIGTVFPYLKLSDHFIKQLSNPDLGQLEFPEFMLYDPSAKQEPFTNTISARNMRAQIMVMERADLTMDIVIRRIGLPGSLVQAESPAKFVTHVLMQVIAALHVLQISTLFTHYDLHLANIFLNKIDQKDRTRYVVFDVDSAQTAYVNLPSSEDSLGVRRYIAKLGDFGMSSIAAGNAILAPGTDAYADSFSDLQYSELPDDHVSHSSVFYPSFDLWRLALDVVMKFELPERKENRIIYKFCNGTLSENELKFLKDWQILYRILLQMLKHSDSFMPVRISRAATIYFSGLVPEMLKKRMASFERETLKIPAETLRNYWVDILSQMLHVISYTPESPRAFAAFYDPLLFEKCGLLTHRCFEMTPDRRNSALPVKVLQFCIDNEFLQTIEDRAGIEPRLKQLTSNAILWRAVANGPDTKTRDEINSFYGL